MKSYTTVLNSPLAHGQFGYALVFSESIGIYRLSNELLVLMNERGEISSINAKKIGIFDHVSINEKQIIAAENIAKTAFTEKSYTFDKVMAVEVDKYGDPYLVIRLKNAEGEYNTSYRINVLNVK